MESHSTIVMAGLDPAIQKKKGLDHRVKPGDDKREWFLLKSSCSYLIIVACFL
jgi:hypothetical protein